MPFYSKQKTHHKIIRGKKQRKTYLSPLHWKLQTFVKRKYTGLNKHPIYELEI